VNSHTLDGHERGEAREALALATDKLRGVLDASGVNSAKGPLNALWWSLGQAPDTGYSFMDAAGEQMRAAGGELDLDPPRAAALGYQLTTISMYQSRFARESVLRYLHASGDLLAMTVNTALSLGVPERSCYLNVVIREADGEPRLGALAAILRELAESPEFKYAADATNRMKHRNYLPGSIKATLNDDGASVRVDHRTLAFDEQLPLSLEGLRHLTDVLRALATSALMELTKLI
jgi:hypothetical protein